ncbi:hypothetical protein QUB28_11695 [Microcoleus sp. B4-C3]
MPVPQRYGFSRFTGILPVAENGAIFQFQSTHFQFPIPNSQLPITN